MKPKGKNKAKTTKRTKPPICPYCGATARLVPASEVIKNPQDTIKWAYVCANYPECDSFVAVHTLTKEPMGPLANRELRRLRYEAHKVFDRLWQEGIMTKTDAYRWLSSSLCMKGEYAHIGQFSEPYCQKTIDLANEVLRRIKKGEKTA